MAPKGSKDHEKKSKKGAESVSPTPQNAESPESSVDESVVTKKRTTMSQKAGIIFPVKKVLTSLKKIKIAPKIREGAAVYMAGVLEYLSAEILELAGNAARDNHRQRINPRHITLAIRSDEELNDLLKDVIIPEGGVLPHVESALLPARTKIPHSPANE